MRSWKRPSVSLPTLSPGGKGWASARDILASKLQDEHAPCTFPPHWNEADVRGALLAMQGPLCAFCSTEITIQERDDVEHFRPKKGVAEDKNHPGYWWLAYRFDNYLWCCQRCNRIEKQNKFPLLDLDGHHIRYGERNRVGAEERIWVEPTIDPVDSWLTFDKDPIFASYYLLSVRKNYVGTVVHERVRQTCERFRLNQELHYIQTRKHAYHECYQARKSGNLEDVRRKASRYQPHSLIYRFLLEKLAPQSLPSPREELAWLLEDLYQRLRDLHNLEKLYPMDQKTRKDKDETLWALAVLWKQPPHPVPNMEEWLTLNKLIKSERLKEKKALLDQLETGDD